MFGIIPCPADNAHRGPSVLGSLLLLMLLVTAAPILADSSSVESLLPWQQTEFDSICASFRIAACDSGSIHEACKRRDPLALHLEKFARWLVAKQTNYDGCMRDLQRRYECLAASGASPININDLPVAGDQKAPVLITLYVFDLCPACTYLFVQLHWEVTHGALKGKARLAAKLFDERADSTTKARFSRFWYYIAAFNDVPIARDDRKMPIPIVDNTNKWPPAYKKMVYDLKFRTRPVAFREQGSKEASINPPIFINGKRYRGYNNPQWVADAALYEFDELRRHRR